MSCCEALVERDEEVDGARRLAAVDGGQPAPGARRRPARARGRGSARAGERGFIGEGEALGGRLEEEVEGVDDGQLGDQVDLDAEVVAWAAGTTTRARKFPCGSCCQLMKCAAGSTRSE
jgi:hypothetical protein